MRRLAGIVFLAVLQLLAVTHAAWAQGPPEISLRSDTDEIEVGDTVTITLVAMTESGAAQPADPKLTPPRAFRSVGPAVSTQTQMTIVNGRIAQKSGFSASWQLTATQTGSFEIGPVTMMLDGKRRTIGNVRLVVRPAGQRPGLRGKRRPGVPDPFSQLFPFPGLDLDDRRPEPAEAPVDPQLSIDAPLDPQAFLRGVVDKTRVVVGEQVTLSVYLYAQPRVFQVLDPHEPPAADFFQRMLSGGEAEARSLAIGGSRWTAQLIRRVALFPLRAGDLEIGPMTVTLTGPGLRGGGMRGGLVRSSRSFTVQAVEPPVTGRPAGYQLGDVGVYSLAANVEPRAIQAGGSVAIKILLRGSGNVPTTLRLPERKGVSWLDPETREAIDTSAGTVTGSRSFTYVVKLTEPGPMDLGEVSLPFYNPKTAQYQIAKAALGVVQVLGDAAPPPAASAGVRDPFAEIAPGRAAVRAWSPPRSAWTSSAWFWLALFGAPATVILVEGGTRALRSAIGKRRARRDSTEVRVREALGEARDAEKARDGKRAASAVERAVVVAVEGATGLKLRGLLREEVPPALVREGLEESDALEIEGILRACDAWRFEPGDAPSGDHPVTRAEAAAKRLAKLRKPA